MGEGVVKNMLGSLKNYAGGSPETTGGQENINYGKTKTNKKHRKGVCKRNQSVPASLTIYRSLIGSPVSNDGGIVVEISTLFNWELVIILLIGKIINCNAIYVSQTMVKWFRFNQEIITKIQTSTAWYILHGDNIWFLAEHDGTCVQ